MNRLMRRLASVFTGICQSNVAVDNAAHSDATLKNENMYMLTQSEMQTLLKAASDDSKSRKKRKAECRKILAARRYKHGTHVLVEES